MFSWINTYKMPLFCAICGYSEQLITCAIWLAEAEWRIYASVNYAIIGFFLIMACRLGGAKPLSEPMQEYY